MDRAQRFFHHSTPQFGAFRTILSRGDQEMTRSQNRHFHFNHKQKTVKSDYVMLSTLELLVLRKQELRV